MAVLVRMVLEKISFTFIFNYNGEVKKSKAILFQVFYLGRIKLLVGRKGLKIYPELRGPRALPVGELVLWYGMFAPCGRLLGTMGFAHEAP